MKKKRNHNPRLVKLHRSYTVEEAADLYGIHKNRIYQWIKDGLPTCGTKRPLLIAGKDLRTFLEAKRIKHKRPCKPHEIYCVRCRQPREPAAGMVEYLPSTAVMGNLGALCPVCESMMFRRISLAKLPLNPHFLNNPLPLADSHITPSSSPSVNSEFNRGA